MLDPNTDVHEPVSGQILQPGDNSYQAAAVHQSNIMAGLDGLTTGNGFTSTNETSFQEQSLLTPVFLLKNSRINNQINYFAFADANPNGTNQVQMLSINLIGFKGLDKNPDFNDLVVRVNFSLNN